MDRSRVGLLGVGVAAMAMFFVTSCSSTEHEVSAGTTEGSAPPARALSCAGGVVQGVSVALASRVGEPTPEEAIAKFTSFEKALPAEGYAPAADTETATTQVPTAIYLHQSGQHADVELHVVSLDGMTWAVDRARYCP
jgi:hypothetical protein